MITKFKLFESPDECDGNYWRDSDAIVFGYGVKEIPFDEYLDKYDGEGDLDSQEYCDYYSNYYLEAESEERMLVDFGKVKHSQLGAGERYEMCCGRLWTSNELISFWQYPANYKVLRSVLDDIEKACEEMGKEIEITDDWDIEVVIDDTDNIIDPNDEDWAYHEVPGSESGESTFIHHIKIKVIQVKDYKDTKTANLKQYIDSLNSSEEDEELKQHLNRKKLHENLFNKAKEKSKLVEDKPTEGFKIYSDMDGVLTDFDGNFYEQVLKNFNKENGVNIRDGWEFETEYGKKRFWHEVKKLGLKFWSHMTWVKDGKLLWDFIKEYNPEILSRPSAEILSRTGKKMWCDRELPGTVVNLVFRKEKFAKPNHILIDDLESNIESWERKGGIGILHKDSKTTIEKLKNILNI